MPYEYLEHEADMGIKGIGKSWEQAFVEGAKAMFGLMIEIPQRPQGLSPVEIQVEAADMPSLFVEWLNELLAQRELTGLIFEDFKIDKIEEMGPSGPLSHGLLRGKAGETDDEAGSSRFSKAGKRIKLTGRAFGEPLDSKKHKIKTEVKAATYSGLRCEEENGKFYCQCVVDI